MPTFFRNFASQSEKLHDYSMTTMNENTFDYTKIPQGYAYCFNRECPLHAHCMHYLAGQHAPAGRLVGPAVYPWALHDGQCELYRECHPVRMAWGFGRLYAHLPRHLVSAARASVQRYFSLGASTYYRYHHGERKLTPRQQEEVIAIVMGFGSREEPSFDHYAMEYDLT